MIVYVDKQIGDDVVIISTIAIVQHCEGTITITESRELINIYLEFYKTYKLERVLISIAFTDF